MDKVSSINRPHNDTISTIPALIVPIVPIKNNGTNGTILALIVRMIRKYGNKQQIFFRFNDTE